MSLTAERLRELLSYDPETGVFRWKVNRSRTVAGSIAGTDDGQGYLRIMIDGTNYGAHRLAWLYVHGTWPKDQLDHRYGVRNDNRIGELREATNAQNGQNRKLGSNNSSGCTGVIWHSRDRKWVARIKVAGRYRYLGYFASIEDAISARAKAKAALHPFQPTERTGATP